MKNQNNNLGQSIIEYLIVIVIVVAALLAMTGLLKRKVQANFRESADAFGEGRQFEEGVTIVTH